MSLSQLDYRCAECALEISGKLDQVLEAIRLHEHDWATFITEVETSLRYNPR